jgi:hypothetical protein
MAGRRTAVCTAVYPGIEPWLPELCASIAGQTDRDFDVVVILDGLPERTWLERGGRMLAARILQAPAGKTAAEVRNILLANACTSHEALVLVDGDDVMLPERVAAARIDLQRFDVTGCAMELMDQDGRPLGHVFGGLRRGDLPRADAQACGPADAQACGPADARACGPKDDRYIFESNRFGMGNTAWRSAALSACLPVPADCVAADWYVATRARLQGRRFRFDPVPRMRYRQHPNNVAGVLPPFSPDRLLRGARLAAGHFRHVLDLAEAAPGTRYRERLEGASRRVGRFLERAVSDPRWLALFAEELGRSGPLDAWWAFIGAIEED